MTADLRRLAPWRSVPCLSTAHRRWTRLPRSERFLPHWQACPDAAPVESLAIIGYAIISLLSWIAHDGALVVVLEDKEIAGRLYLSPRTAEKHDANLVANWPPTAAQG